MKRVRAPWDHPIARAFRAAPSGMLGLAVLLGILLVAIVAPPIWGEQADELDVANAYQRSSWEHPLGTDAVGHDIFIRLLVATRLSIGLALSAAGLGLLVGVTLGASVTLLGRRTRGPVLRGIDTMLSFPALLKAIFVGTIVGIGIIGALAGVAVAISFSFARVTSTLAMSIGGREYVHAARVLGIPRRRLLVRYVLPNIAEPLIIATSVAVSVAIVAVSALSFLGLGVQAPQFDWGRMLTEGVKNLYLTPMAAIGPAVAIALSALAFGFVGEAFARATNPLLWTAATTEGRRRRPSADPGPPAEGADDTPLAGTGGGTLQVRDLAVSFPGATGQVDVVKGVSFDVEPGQRIGIVGESGSGKTMTALAIAQLTPFPGRVRGSVKLHGQELRKLPKAKLDRLLGRDLAVVFQDPMSSLNPALTIGTQVSERARTHQALSRRAASRLAAAKLTEVHIPTAERQLDRYPHEFSGGMRQRAMIAMGLINEPSVLLADEPTTALDVTIQAQIMELFDELNQAGRMAVVLISHNLALVSQSCDRVIVMYAGRIVEELDAKQLVADPKHPYTQALLGALPTIEQSAQQLLTSIPGEIPDPGDPPPGCPFHPRCPLVVDRCRTERPALLARAGEAGRRVACHVANADG